jgi:hypothetical protein
MSERMEAMLREASAELAFPATPDLAGAVAQRLGEPRRPELTLGTRRPLARALLLAGLTLLATAATVMGASSGARDAVLELFGLRGATVEEVPRLPKAPPPGRAMGARVPLALARGQVGFEILTPAAEPAFVRVSSRVPGGVVSFTAGGLLVTELRASVERDFLVKLRTEGTRVERLQVGGDRGLWLAGSPHVVFLRDGRGRVIQETLSRAGNVLLIERGDVLVRVEGARSLRAAVEAAGNLRRRSVVRGSGNGRKTR